MARLITIFLFIGAIEGCSEKYGGVIQHYQFSGKQAIPQYESLDYWAAHPWKKDPADSLPNALLTEKNDSLADVFFIHPTTYTGSKKEWNADINDAYLNAKTDYSSILYQASVFNEHCRVFAPEVQAGTPFRFFCQ